MRALLAYATRAGSLLIKGLKTPSSSRVRIRQYPNKESKDVCTEMSRARIASIWVAALLFVSVALAQTPQTDSDLYPFIKNDRLGFLNWEGREVIPAQFSTAADATVFREGIANVGATGGWTYIDGSGKFIVGSQFWWAYPFSEGYACVLLPGEGAGYGFIDKTGRLLIKGLRAPSAFHDGLAPILVGSKWGYLGTDMQMTIPAQFDFATSFSEGMAPVQVGEKWGYIDKSGQLAVQPKYDITMHFTNGLGMVKIFSERRPLVGEIGMEGQTTEDVYLWGFVDQHGAEALAPKFLEATDFSEGYAFVVANDGTKLFGIIDKSGKYIHEPAFDEATPFSESRAAVRAGEKWGYVDHDGRWAIPPNLTHAEPFRHGLARVAFEPGQWGYIDKGGSVVWQNKSK